MERREDRGSVRSPQVVRLLPPRVSPPMHLQKSLEKNAFATAVDATMHGDDSQTWWQTDQRKAVWAGLPLGDCSLPRVAFLRWHLAFLAAVARNSNVAFHNH